MRRILGYAAGALRIFEHQRRAGRIAKVFPDGPCFAANFKADLSLMPSWPSVITVSPPRQRAASHQRDWTACNSCAYSGGAVPWRISAPTSRADSLNEREEIAMFVAPNDSQVATVAPGR
jgi:hypothetical protein